MSRRFITLSSLIMQPHSSPFPSVGEMLRTCKPREPVYCIYPHVYRDTTKEFLRGFPGRVLYAVKANNHPHILRLLNQAGVVHFDCASLPEIELVRTVCPGAKVYFMVPVVMRGAAGEAFHDHGVRHFMTDHPAGLESLAGQITMSQCVVFARMAVSHASAIVDLSSKFGALPDEIPELLCRIQALGAEPALAFNVGTMVTSPEAYRHSIEVAVSVLGALDFKVRLIDIGGGFPKSYPGFSTPPLEDFFLAVSESAHQLPLLAGGEIMAEPGRALSAPGLSAVVEVLLRKGNRLYLNDGMYGIFWELRFEAHKRYPVRVFRNGRALDGPSSSFSMYGPTCDSSDRLPGAVDLPEGVQRGDYLEFGNIGAYSLSGRTDFNGHFSDTVVEITSPGEYPPGLCPVG